MAEIKPDQKPQYPLSQPWVFPDGSQISVYSDPEASMMLIQHSSGSAITFCPDGSVIIKAVGEIHTHANAGKGVVGPNDVGMTERTNGDRVIEVQGKLRIKCSQLDIECSSTGRVTAGTDLLLQANNHIIKATEAVAIEPRKTFHLDTKEVRQRFVSIRTENGTAEDFSGAGTGGARNTLNVSGHYIIRNDDPNGSISFYSKGGMNLICGGERVDTIGNYTDSPSTLARATYTQIVNKPKNAGTATLIGKGDIYTETDSDFYILNGKVKGNFVHVIPKGDYFVSATTGNYVKTVGKNDFATIKGGSFVKATGIIRVTSKQIFLN